MRAHLRDLLLGLVPLLGACAEPAPSPTRFAVRARWPGEPSLRYRIDAEGGPLAPADCRAAIEAALAEWQASGCVRFEPAAPGATPDVVFSFGHDLEAACIPFGLDPGVAHAGPVAPGTFVHFDPERAWDGPRLRQAALHELGHVLGLDHSADEAAVLFPEPAPERAHLSASDRAGLHSLYGGGASGPGDLVVSGGPTLHGVAPPELTGWTLLDADGDGDEEILVWRTDAAGHGALTSYHFTRGPVLARTLGPLYGVVVPGIEPELVVMPAGERLVIPEPERAPVRALAFDAEGVPQPFQGELEPRRGSPASPAEPCGDLDWGDLDGDGQRELVRLRP